jgi:MazG family protein
MSDQKSWHEATVNFEKFCNTVAALRHPKTGCPWDLEQTHATLRKYMIEEAYEAAEVMEPIHHEKLRDELGDVLLQVVLNSQIASETGNFTVSDVISSIDKKMRRRHPHVFDAENSTNVKSSTDVRLKWDEIKETETANQQIATGYFSKLKPSSVTPSSHLAVTIGKLAKKINFDWTDPLQVLEQVESEIRELRAEIESGTSKQKIDAEMGDVFFSLHQLCRHLEIDPEICAMQGNQKFLNRFSLLEKMAIAKKINVTSAGTPVLEQLWKEAKAQEKDQG